MKLTPLFPVLLLAPLIGQAADYQLDVGGSYGDYRDSLRYDSIAVGTVRFSADSRRWGASAAYSSTRIEGGPWGSDIDQDDYYLSGRYRWLAGAGGNTQLRADLYRIENDDPSRMSDDVDAAGLFLSRTPADGSWWLQGGVVASDYRNVDLNLTQATAAAGLALNQQWDWLQLRASYIHSDAPVWTQEEDRTAAVELAWTHWFQPAREPGFTSLTVSAMAGERILYYDPDAASLTNRPDLLNASYNLTGNWHFGGGTRLLLVLGRDEFENHWLPEDYVNHRLSASLSLSW